MRWMVRALVVYAHSCYRQTLICIFVWMHKMHKMHIHRDGRRHTVHPTCSKWKPPDCVRGSDCHWHKRCCSCVEFAMTNTQHRWKAWQSPVSPCNTPFPAIQNTQHTNKNNEIITSIFISVSIRNSITSFTAIFSCILYCICCYSTLCVASNGPLSNGIALKQYCVDPNGSRIK